MNVPAAGSGQADAVMKDESEQPKETKEEPAGASAVVEGSEAKQAENQDKAASPVEKEPVTKPISQGQLLWVSGVANRDAEMVDEDDQDDPSSGSDDQVDPELKKKCLQAQDAEKLFTLNINTYKVCQLNTILSAMGLKLEPKEQVLTAIRRK